MFNCTGHYPVPALPSAANPAMRPHNHPALCPCVPINSNSCKLRAISKLSKAGSSPHKKPQLCCWRRPLMVRQPYSEAVWAPFLSPTRGTEGVVKTIERAVGTSPVPWGERGLGKAVDPPLRVREDWWVFERPFFNGKKLCQWAQWKFTFKLPSAASFINKRRTGWF